MAAHDDRDEMRGAHDGEKVTIAVTYDVNADDDRTATEELEVIFERITSAIAGNASVSVVESGGDRGVCPIDGSALVAHMDYPRMFVCSHQLGHTFGLIHGDPKPSQ